MDFPKNSTFYICKPVEVWGYCVAEACDFKGSYDKSFRKKNSPHNMSMCKLVFSYIGHAGEK